MGKTSLVLDMVVVRELQLEMEQTCFLIVYDQTLARSILNDLSSFLCLTWHADAIKDKQEISIVFLVLNVFCPESNLRSIALTSHKNLCPPVLSCAHTYAHVRTHAHSHLSSAKLYSFAWRHLFHFRFIDNRPPEPCPWKQSQLPSSLGDQEPVSPMFSWHRTQRPCDSFYNYSYAN